MDQEEMDRLQDLVLERLLTSRALPGQETPLSFPDLAYVTDAEEALILEDGYAGHSPLVTEVDEPELRRRLTAGEAGFLQFQPPLSQADATTLRLRVNLGFADLDPLPLGELVVTFTQRGDDWVTIAPTHALAF